MENSRILTRTLTDRFIRRPSVLRGVALLTCARAALLALSKKLAAEDWERVHARIEEQRKYLVRNPSLVPSLVSQKLLVSGEDHRHAWHRGVDPIAVCRAIWRGVFYGLREGASTIEQQLVRTITGQYQRSLKRKLKEMALALLVCDAFEKKDIPAIYLAIAYYGWRMNGYRQACKRLCIRPDSSTLNQAARLVARLKYPEPRITPTRRRQQIDCRTKHLITLYCRHAYDGTYAHLDAPTLHGRYVTSGLAKPISDR